MLSNVLRIIPNSIMEFPQAGNQCHHEDCKQLDFLPVVCDHCQFSFCKEHSPTQSHNCTQFCDKVVEKKPVLRSPPCSVETCKKPDPLNITCTKCSLCFCLEHRHHKCTELEISQSKRQKWQAPRDQFKIAKESTDKVIQKKLESTKNRALANKIKLMKLKRVAVGDNHIPTTDRVFFAVAPPLEGKEKSNAKALFTSKQWSLGRSIDLMAKRLKIVNRNNEIDGSKLRVFNVDGEIISNQMDVLISSLLSDGTLVDGDSLILENISLEEINSGKTTFSTDKCELKKFIWL